MKLCIGETWGVAQARWKPAEESVWLVEQRAAVVTKPRARRPCMVKNKIKIKIDDPGAGRLTGGYENPNMGLVVWTEMLSL